LLADQRDLAEYTFEKKYNFTAYNWTLYDKISIIRSKDSLVTNIIKESSCFFDISGYAFSSSILNKFKFKNFEHSLSYLMSIVVAKNFSIPYFILPQSIGPFDYPLFYRKILKFLSFYILKYPRKIFVREKKYLDDLEKISGRDIVNFKDIVLVGEAYDLKNIYKERPVISEKNILNDSVGVILNRKIFDRIGADEFFDVYDLVIKKLLSKNKNVYIFRHSYEDLDLCISLKSKFGHNENVIFFNDDFNCFELEKIISKLDFVIASRYHSVIHAYKNKVPALCISWANKYYELLDYFSQLKYLFDCRQKINKEELSKSLDSLLSNYLLEKGLIGEKMEEVRKEYSISSLFKF